MDADLRVRYRSLDPALIGSRFREARVRAGLTQHEVAADDVSPAYISRIESGDRRPAIELLERLAARLGSSLGDLLAPDTDSPSDFEEACRLRLELDYAELALRTGDVGTALREATVVAKDLSAPGELRREARRVRAQALEAAGDLNAAIGAWEDLVTDEPPGVRLVGALTALCRCYREAGDLGRAVEVGRRAAARLQEVGLTGSTEGVRLALTRAVAHLLRGDLDVATEVCVEELTAAEALDSPAARASAYWSSSVAESRSGRRHSALRLAAQALALHDPVDGTRETARLRTQLGLLHLKADPPATDEAIRQLHRSGAELASEPVGSPDLLRNQLVLARAHAQRGELDTARDVIAGLADDLDDLPPLAAADARLIQGQIAAAAGRTGDATRSYRASAQLLARAGVERDAGEIWLELGTLLEESGEVTDALAAYRAAAASVGLATRTGSVATPVGRRTPVH